MIINQARKNELLGQIEQSRNEVTTKLTRISSLGKHLQKHVANLEQFFANRLESEVNRHGGTEQDTRQLVDYAGWENTAWQQINIAPTKNINRIRVGDISHTMLKNTFEFPAVIPFVGANNTYIIKSSDATKSLQFLQSLVVRTALMFPHQTRYTLLDPAGAGIAFPMRRYLPLVTENSSDVRRDLEGVIATIQRVIESYLDASVRSFEEIPEDIRANERYSFVFAANFPQQYDRRAIDALQQISNTGPAAGTYTFIHWNEKYELPRDITMDSFKNAVYIDLDSTTSAALGWMSVVYDRAPSPELQQQLFDKLRDAKAPERTIAWRDVVGVDEDEWWQGDSSTIINTPVGIKSATEKLNVWFGVNAENRPSAHGMMGAMTGSGKSTYCHVLISGLAIRYSPDQLRLYLIDGKNGVEFEDYRGLPHAEVVSLRTSPELSRSVLEDLVKQKEWRNSVFTKAKVADLKSYREKGQPFGNMPRILLIIDEYQELFEGDKDGVASSLMAQIAAQGRSAGIHMLLISQRFGASGMLNQSAIFGNMHLLVGMQMKPDDVTSMTQFGRRGKALVATCDLPGKIVINDRGGDDAGNVAGKVAYLSSDERKQLIRKLQEKHQATSHTHQRIVLDGQAQPVLSDNPLIARLSGLPNYPSPEELQQIARRDVLEGGFGISDWFAAERPSIAGIGQEFNVRGQATVILKRQMGANALVIGSTNAVRYAILSAMMISYALNNTPNNAQFYIIDRSIVDAAWSNTLRNVSDTILVPSNYTVQFVRDTNRIESSLQEVNDLITVRRNLDEYDVIKQPNVYVFLTELDSIELMRRKTDSYGGASYSPAGELLRNIFTNGPTVGVHVIMSFTSVRALSRVIDERRLDAFQHRIALQMSEDESHTLIRSRKASQLQVDGPTPICALYVDIESDKSTKFKPFSIENAEKGPDFFQNQLEQIAATMKGRA